MIRNRRAIIEQLESRTLLSVNIGGEFLNLAVTDPAALAPVAAPGLGVNIRARAGVPFTKEVAFYASPEVTTGTFTATIDWGDGVTSAGVVTYGAEGNKPGYEIMGSSVYAEAGLFRVTTVLSLTSSPVGAAASAPSTTSVVATIHSDAVVSPLARVSPLGVTLTEVAGQGFTDDVGAVFLPAVQNEIFTATINWGDGTTSAGQLAPTTITNATGETEYEIIGGHTYSQNGTYPVRIVVDETPAAVGTRRRNLMSSIAGSLCRRGFRWRGRSQGRTGSSTTIPSGV